MKGFISVFALFCFAVSYCQTGTISGHVYDRFDHTVLVGCTVQLLGSRYGDMVGSDGYYEITRIPPGTYSLVAYYLSKGDSTITQVKVSAGDHLVHNFVLPRYCNYDKSKGNKRCPQCLRKDKAIPVAYGLPMDKVNQRRVYHMGCDLPVCMANWYCKRDKMLF